MGRWGGYTSGHKGLPLQELLVFKKTSFLLRPYSWFLFKTTENFSSWQLGQSIGKIRRLKNQLKNQLKKSVWTGGKYNNGYGYRDE